VGLNHHEPRGDKMADTMSLDKFLLRYFRQLHFNSMPAPKRKRFESYVDKNDFIGDMKSWADDLLKHNDNGEFIKEEDKDENGNPIKGTSHYVNNDFPGASDMDVETWKRLYELLQLVFTRLSNNRDSLDKATVAFLDKYFGNKTDHIFSPAPLEQDTKEAVKVLFDAFKSLDEKSAYTLFARCLHNEETPTLFEFRDFKSAIEDGSYEKKPAIRKTLRKFIVGLSDAINNGENIGLKVTPMTLETIFYGLDPAKEATNEDVKKLQPKTKDILSAIHDSEKIAADVKTFDNGKISEPLEKAIKKTDYTGKITENDYIADKYEDHRNFFEQTKKDVKDWVDDKLGFFKKFHREHIYHNPAAETIMGAILDVGISPTSGLKAIIEKENDIIAKLQGKQPLVSVDYFKDMVKELKRLKDGGMKNAFENATKEPGKMRRLAEQIGRNAADLINSPEYKDNKDKRHKLKQETKTAMEIMQVMEYGTFDGKLVEGINNTELKIASDPALSFNKNKTVQSITSAVDATLKKTIQLAAYAGTGIANQIRRTQAKMKHSGVLEVEHLKWQEKNKAEKTNFETTKQEQDAADYQEIQKYEDIKKNTKITDIDDAESQLTILNGNKAIAQESLDDARDELQTLKNKSYDTIGFSSIEKYYKSVSSAEKQVDANQKALKQAQDKLDKLQKQENDFQEYNKLTTKFAKKAKHLYNLETKMHNASTQDLDKLNQEFEQQTKERDQLKQQMKKLAAKYTPKGQPISDTHLVTLHKNLVAPNGLLARAKRGLVAAQKNLDDSNKELQTLKGQENSVKAYEKLINDANAKVSNTQSNYDICNNAVNNMEQNIATYKNAQSEIDEYTKAIEERKKQLENWNQDHVDYYDYFMGYWDFLHTGNTKRLLQFSKKAAQKAAYKEDGMEKKLMDYMQKNDYSYAA